MRCVLAGDGCWEGEPHRLARLLAATPPALQLLLQAQEGARESSEQNPAQEARPQQLCSPFQRREQGGLGRTQDQVGDPILAHQPEGSLG